MNLTWVSEQYVRASGLWRGIVEIKLEPHEYITAPEEAFALACGVPFFPRVIQVKLRVSGVEYTLNRWPYKEPLREAVDQVIRQTQLR